METEVLTFRSAGLGTIRAMLEKHITPCPCDKTIRQWFDAAKIPRFKSNAGAKRGGGHCYYSMPHVERWLNSRFGKGTR